MNKDFYFKKGDCNSGFIEKKTQSLILWTLVLVGTLYFVWHDFYSAFWYDEVYTMHLVSKSFKGIWSISGNDVHPPLYYILLKGYLFVSSDSIFSYRFFSTIPIILMMVVGATLVRKYFTFRTSLFFILFVILVPANQYASSEIRMYSWAMFFVFIASLYVYRILTTFRCKYFILFTLFSLSAAYTHYYALLGVFFFYCILFIYLVFKRRDKLIIFFASVFLFLLAYSPWLINMFSQIKGVKEDYWISPPSLKYLLLYFYYPFASQLGTIETDYRIGEIAGWFLLFVLMSGLILSLIIRSLRQWISTSLIIRKNLFYGCICILVYIITIFTGFFASLLIKPVFISRYSICVLGLLLIGLSLCLTYVDLQKRINRIFLSMVFIISLCFSISRFITQCKSNVEKELIQAELYSYAESKISGNTAFLYSDKRFFDLAIFTALFPDSHHYCKIDLLKNNYKTMLENFTYTPIFSFDEVDTIYDNILIMKNVDEGLSSFMALPEDSIEVIKYYDIVDRTNIKGCVVYELKRN